MFSIEVAGPQQRALGATADYPSHWTLLPLRPQGFSHNSGLPTSEAFFRTIDIAYIFASRMESVPLSIFLTNGRGSYVMNWCSSKPRLLDGWLLARSQWLLKRLRRSPLQEQPGYGQWIQKGRWIKRCRFRSCRRPNDDWQPDAGQGQLLRTRLFKIGEVLATTLCVGRGIPP